MSHSFTRHIQLSALALAALLAACGGGGDSGDPGASAQAADSRERILKGADCSGSCSGGGGTPVAGTNPLPTTAPAPDVLVRESFGSGPANVRPKGGKGDLRSAFVGSTLGGFWVEWPGNKNTAWITSAGEATWKFTSSSNPDGGNPNLLEMPSPLEVGVYGQVWSDITDGAPGGYPTALLPVAWPTGRWALSMAGILSQAPGSTLALGLTDSSQTVGNLTSASKVTLLIKLSADGYALDWQLWQGGASRTLLAAGLGEDLGFNRLALIYDPQTQLLSAEVNGVSSGNFPVNLGIARYAAFEGNGVVDDFVLRTLPPAAP